MIAPLRQDLLFQAKSAEPAQSLIPTLSTAFEARGCVAYDPFPGGAGSPPGKVQRFRLFVAPEMAGWRRVLVGEELTEDWLISLTNTTRRILLDVQIVSVDDFQLTVYRPDQTPDSRLTALGPFLRPGSTPDALLQAAQPDTPQPSSSEQQRNTTLPPALQQLATEKGIQTHHVDKMMGRLTRRLFRKMTPDDTVREQAIAALSSQIQTTVDWNSSGASRLRAIMAHLSVPDKWYEPDWKTLVSAYQVARQRQRGTALLLPGDEEALAQVPDVLSYTPLYYAQQLT